ncbi:hypothetical protein VDGL01_01961 [Verticillium dahliae]
MQRSIPQEKNDLVTVMSIAYLAWQLRGGDEDEPQASGLVLV